MRVDLYSVTRNHTHVAPRTTPKDVRKTIISQLSKHLSLLRIILVESTIIYHAAGTSDIIIQLRSTKRAWSAMLTARLTVTGTSHPQATL
jgi:hypothetical protein